MGSIRRPTLADVAEHASVSTVTVSRVVDGSTKVAAATRQRVLDAMREIGYFGNAAAKNLVSGQATTVGVVTSNTSEFGYASTIAGIELAARNADMVVLISVVEATGEAGVLDTVATVASHAPAGVIVMDFDEAGHAVLEQLPAYLPVISTAGADSTSRPSVSIDEHIGAQLAAEHLIGLGHSSIFVLAPPDTRPAERRSLGTLASLEAARLPHYPVVRCADWQPGSGYAAASQLLDDYGDRITALACGNDEIALGAMRAIHDRGLRVPDDISVVGFDDHPLAAYTQPSLTTVAQDFRELGRLAFTHLRALLAGTPSDEPTVVTPALCIRESTAAPNPSRGLRAR